MNVPFQTSPFRMCLFLAWIHRRTLQKEFLLVCYYVELVHFQQDDSDRRAAVSDELHWTSWLRPVKALFVSCWFSLSTFQMMTFCPITHEHHAAVMLRCVTMWPRGESPFSVRMVIKVCKVIAEHAGKWSPRPPTLCFLCSEGSDAWVAAADTRRKSYYELWHWKAMVNRITFFLSDIFYYVFLFYLNFVSSLNSKFIHPKQIDPYLKWVCPPVPLPQWGVPKRILWSIH